MDFSVRRLLLQQAEGKALGPHPAFMGHEPVSVYSPGSNTPRTDAVISQQEASRHQQAYGGDQAIDWVYDCIGLYTDPISTAPYTLENTDGTKFVKTRKKGTPPDHKDGPQDLYRLLDAPNPFMLYDELMTLLVIDLLLVGNAYWLKWRMNSSGKPLALYRLCPSHVKITPAPYGPKSYEYQPPGAADKLIISPDQIVHFRRPNPHSYYYGMGVIQGAGRAMDLELAVTDTVTSYYGNRADPSLIVQSDRRVPRDVFNKLRAQLWARASGPKHAGELLVLEAGLKASSLSRSASDSLFEELTRMSQDRVYAKFRASRKLFGYIDTAGADKISDVRREFDNTALRPFMDKLQNVITAGLTKAWDVDFKIDYRFQLAPEDLVKVNAEIAALPGIKVRELRRLYKPFGIEESTGDPKIDEMVLNLPGENLGPDGKPVNGGAGFADRPLGSEPGRPPLGQNTRAFPAGARVRQPQGKAFDDIAARVEALALIEPEGKASPSIPGEQRPDDPFATARSVDITDVTVSIAAELRDAVIELERGLLDHVEGKALKSSDLVGRIKNSEAWKTFSARITRVIEDGARRAAQSAAMHSTLTPDEDIDYDAIAQSIVHRPDGVRSIVRTLKERVTNRIKAARDANAERTEFEAAVRSAIAEWADSQAVTIADSEATEAYNEGTLTVAEMSGVDQFYVVEEDDAPDEACQKARGQIWDLKTARANRKEHPRCRRAFLPITEVSS